MPEALQPRRPRMPAALLMLAPAAAALLSFAVLPLAFIGVYSFWLSLGPAAVKETLTLANWRQFFADPYYLDVLGATVKYAAVTTAICAVIGYVPAYCLAFSASKRKNLYILLLFLPFWISYVIRTMSWINVLGKKGLVNEILTGLGLVSEPIAMLYNAASVYMGLINYLLPFMIINVYVGLTGIDRNLLDAARTLGATESQVFRAITLPLSLPGLGAGCLLCFVISAGSFVTPLILGGPENVFFSNLIFNRVIAQLDFPFGATLSLVLFVLLGTVVMVYSRYAGIGQLMKSFS